YGIDLSSAKFDVDYKATFVLPFVDEGVDPMDRTLTHNLDLSYAFTKDVKLTVGGSVKQSFDQDWNMSNQFGYKAGLSVSF
ncbi:MAG TPA: hypothetical protein PLM25_04640, partial [Limnochordia bacterium]|nr:hypothetical protein [Limnochordia bacterium]